MYFIYIPILWLKSQISNYAGHLTKKFKRPSRIISHLQNLTMIMFKTRIIIKQ